MDQQEKHQKVIELLNTACTAICDLAEYDEFLYDIFYSTFIHDLKLVEAVQSNNKVDIDEPLLLLSRILNIDIKTIVEDAIAQLNVENRLKRGVGDLSDAQKELANKISDGFSTVDDFKKFNFDKFISTIDLGELDGNTR